MICNMQYREFIPISKKSNTGNYDFKIKYPGNNWYVEVWFRKHCNKITQIEEFYCLIPPQNGSWEALLGTILLVNFWEKASFFAHALFDMAPKVMQIGIVKFDFLTILTSSCVINQSLWYTVFCCFRIIIESPYAH